MSAPHPTRLRHREMPVFEVDWDGLDDGWETSDYRLRRPGESSADEANRIRALVVRGLAPANALDFADWLSP